jgi:hypothetical protein
MACCAHTHIPTQQWLTHLSRSIQEQNTEEEVHWQGCHAHCRTTGKKRYYGTHLCKAPSEAASGYKHAAYDTFLSTYVDTAHCAAHTLQCC